MFEREKHMQGRVALVHQVSWRFALEGDDCTMAESIRTSLGQGGPHVKFKEVERDPDCVVLFGRARSIETAVAARRRKGDTLVIVAVLRDERERSCADLLYAGADECIVGMSESTEFCARVHAILRRGLSVTDGGTEVGEIALDATGLRIRVRDVVATVSRRQFDIFALLAENLERWVSSDAIIARACGTSHDAQTSLVRVHVHKLRRALGPMASCIRADGHRSYMLTVASDRFGKSASSRSGKSAVSRVWRRSG